METPETRVPEPLDAEERDLLNTLVCWALDQQHDSMDGCGLYFLHDGDSDDPEASAAVEARLHIVEEKLRG